MSFLMTRLGVGRTPLMRHVSRWWPYVLTPAGSPVPAGTREQWAQTVLLPCKLLNASRRRRDLDAIGTEMISVKKIPTHEASGSQNEVVASLALLWENKLTSIPACATRLTRSNS